MHSESLWRHAGRNSKPEKPKQVRQVPIDKGHMGADGNYYTNATEYYRHILNSKNKGNK